MSDSGGKIEELKQFLKELKRYREVLYGWDSVLENEEHKKDPLLEKFLPKRDREKLVGEWREKLVLKQGQLKDEIAKLIGRTDMNEFNRTWNRALNPVFNIGVSIDALSLCIDYTLEAIGRLDKKEMERIDKGEKYAFQKIWYLIDHLWQVTVKAAFEGIVNGIRKP